MTNSKIIFTGIQPSGMLHLGNYIGMIQQLKTLSNESNTKIFLMIADLHSLTTQKNSKVLQQNITDLIVSLFACGALNTPNVTLFTQSAIAEHAELAWILSTITPIGCLNRMTQFKDKSQSKKNDDINCGLFTYPVLMAADILLYNTTHVPVGDDQKQHLELARDTAVRFNQLYKNSFVIPEPLICKHGARIMSLKDGTKKMSKSDASETSKIIINDSNDVIAKKIRSAKTDSIANIYYDKENRPEISNLIEILAAVQNKTIQQVETEHIESTTKTFKEALAAALIAELSPIRQKIEECSKNTEFIAEILQNGNKIASEMAGRKMLNIKRVVGLK